MATITLVVHNAYHLSEELYVLSQSLTAVHVSEGTQPRAKHTGQMAKLHPKHLTKGSEEDITIPQRKEKPFS